MKKKPLFKSSLILIFFILFLPDLSGQKPEYQLHVLNKNKDGVTCLDYSPDGRNLLFGSGNRKAKIWDYKENKILWETNLPREIYAAKYLPNGKFFLVNGGNQILIYDSIGEYINTMKGHATAIWSMDTDPEGRFLISGCFAKTFRLWDISEVKLLDKNSQHSKSVLAVCFNSMGTKFASGSLDESIKIWSWPEKQLLHSFIAHSENIYDLEFHPAGKILASASRDKSIKLWNVGTGKLIRVLKGHTESVFCLSFSPNGHFLISGATTGNIKLWEIATGKCIHTFIGHEGPVSSIHFHPDGTSFASGSYDETLRIWEFSPELIVSFCCASELESEISSNEMFLSKGEDESKSEYKFRLQEQEKIKTQLVKKYYQEYLVRLNSMQK